MARKRTQAKSLNSQVLPRQNGTNGNCETVKISSDNEYLKIVEEIEANDQFKQGLLKYSYSTNEMKRILTFLYRCHNFKLYLKNNSEDTNSTLENIESSLHCDANLEESARHHVVYYLIEKWSKCIRNFIAQNCQTDFHKLQVVVLGSIGLNGFNTSTAFVADDNFDNSSEVPFAVKNFIEFLKVTSKLNLDLKGYDYTASQAKKNGFLFINTCLSTNYDDIINCLCTTEFIRLVLEKKFKLQQKVAVLDLRLVRYVNFNSINKNIDHDSSYYLFSLRGDWFKIVDNNAVENYHHIVRLGDPAYWNLNNRQESVYITNELQRVIKSDFKINRIYFKSEYEFLKTTEITSSKQSMFSLFYSQMTEIIFYLLARCNFLDNIQVKFDRQFSTPKLKVTTSKKTQENWQHENNLINRRYKEQNKNKKLVHHGFNGPPLFLPNNSYESYLLGVK